MKLEQLHDHLRRGGAATLNHPATYAVASGAVIAPARYAGARGSGSEFVFEWRHVDGEFRRTTLIDSKGSQANRSEDGLLAARRDGEPASLVPVIEVAYPSRPLLDLSLPTGPSTPMCEPDPRTAPPLWARRGIARCVTRPLPISRRCS